MLPCTQLSSSAVVFLILNTIWPLTGISHVEWRFSDFMQSFCCFAPPLFGCEGWISRISFAKLSSLMWKVVGCLCWSSISEVDFKWNLWNSNARTSVGEKKMASLNPGIWSQAVIGALLVWLAESKREVHLTSRYKPGKRICSGEGRDRPLDPV